MFALRLALPAGYRLESVTGDKVSQWVERAEDGAPLVEVTLKERTLGAYTLNLVARAELPAAAEDAGHRRRASARHAEAQRLHHRRHRSRHRRQDRRRSMA